ncbi:MAG: sugar phosphate nucleotidyltransferase [Bryobacterales bacterium]
MKALLIAGRETPGLAPLADVTPAPLLPLLGAPLVFPLLQRVAHSGIRDVMLVCATRGAAYLRVLHDGRPWGLNLAVVELGDAADSVSQAVSAARSRGFFDETLAVLPANCWTAASWASLERMHHSAGGGLSRLFDDGNPTDILIADPDVDLSSAPCNRLAVEQLRYRPVRSWPEYWTLASDALQHPHLRITPRYDRVPGGAYCGPLARLDFAAVDCEGPIWLGPDSRVHAGAVLRGPVWIGAGCHVGPGVRLESCALEAGARLHGPLELTQALVVANRAIDLVQGGVAVLAERGFGHAEEHDSEMSLGLLQLATRTARREAWSRTQA